MEKINIAYIDAANLDKAVKDAGWSIDYKKFRIWLKDKYKIEKAYIFIGLVDKYKNLYTYFQECGFLVIFKGVLYQNGKIKGNCDSDLLVKALTDYYEHELATAILVASDGDYAPLVTVLKEKSAFRAIISPANTKKCSILLKRLNVPIVYLEDKRKILE